MGAALYPPKPTRLPVKTPLMVWWFDGLVVWWFGGSVVWWFGGLVGRWFGGLVVWWFDLASLYIHITHIAMPMQPMPKRSPLHRPLHS
jgi:hypothetical protein